MTVKVESVKNGKLVMIIARYLIFESIKLAVSFDRARIFWIL